MELREVFEPVVKFLKNLQKKDKEATSKEKAKERLQLVLMQDRASVSPDFFEMMKKEIIEVIKKYIEIDEEALEVQLTRGFEDGDGTGPALFANIPIKNIKPVAKKIEEKIEEFEAKERLEENKAVESHAKVEETKEEKTETVQEKKEEETKEEVSENTVEKIEEKNEEVVEDKETKDEEKNEKQEESVSDDEEKNEAVKKETKKKAQTKGRKTTKK